LAFAQLFDGKCLVYFPTLRDYLPLLDILIYTKVMQISRGLIDRALGKNQLREGSALKISLSIPTSHCWYGCLSWAK